ncbi:hypothetical protein E3E31_03020 [Thermococcus sp. M39]|uniref:hypothetical protein n=1 Tax=unclassified Thermococcus TaxID=2627626 RepID=UPI001439FB07|nr:MULTISPECIES: hypothetical protein [unclassified Thermococcus]NJE07504.1 hypothetical protein [Thermococcus sp. M39]NJE13828.1 hypothetical protein [Thermococcus sp. LS2]
MNAKNLVGMLLKLQSLIVEGSLEIKLGGNFITISKDEIIVDISSPGEITKLARALKESMKSGITKTIKSIPDVMKLIAEVGEELYEAKKTLIIKYRGRDVAIMGFKANPGILGMNNVEIKDKVELMRLISALLMISSLL